MKRRILVVVSALGFAILAPRDARAQWAVVDASNLIQNTTTAINSVRQVLQLIEMVRATKQQLEYQLQNVKSLVQTRPGSLQELIDFYDNANMAYRSLVANVDSISWNVRQVDSDFQRLFPKDKAGWRAVPSNQFDARYTAWSSELTSSALIGMRSQTQLESMERANQRVRLILDQQVLTRDAGEVRLLQSIAQILGVMQSQISTIVQLLSTSGRILAGMAASSAGNDMLTREAKKRRRDGYLNRGRPPKTLTRMP